MTADQIHQAINRLADEAFALEYASAYRRLRNAEHERLAGLYSEIYELQAQRIKITKEV